MASPDRYMAVFSRSDLFPSNRILFAALKDLDRPAGAVEVVTTAISSHTVQVRLAAASYAHFVHLILPIETVTFSDNYFDLRPGEDAYGNPPGRDTQHRPGNAQRTLAVRADCSDLPAPESLFTSTAQ